ncbi:uncharacterized protein EI90DRAFT_1565961 [Cantharellus anzutake]|uniref:uncharacterized protein n=1 Tax=Cantharellus anzutake TaxID=1750568 RepID=UPI0019071315|nr:uncharacterized protein EI90DRAFT_1565961 [Cantharellus anzutake]KAF8328359.1 hypothetical protein EI90DRAFT_1565961 [Cantharellus anzutake]
MNLNLPRGKDKLWKPPESPQDTHDARKQNKGEEPTRSNPIGQMLQDCIHRAPGSAPRFAQTVNLTGGGHVLSLSSTSRFEIQTAPPPNNTSSETITTMRRRRIQPRGPTGQSPPMWCIPGHTGATVVQILRFLRKCVSTDPHFIEMTNQFGNMIFEAVPEKCRAQEAHVLY